MGATKIGYGPLSLAMVCNYRPFGIVVRNGPDRLVYYCNHSEIASDAQLYSYGSSPSQRDKGQTDEHRVVYSRPL